MKIFKYPLKVEHIQQVMLPQNAKILSVQVQAGTLCIWAQIDEVNALEDRTIEVFGTGHAMSDEPRRYIGTVQMHGGALVWHVFERIN